MEFALFLGGALAITAFPMLARLLQERRMADTPIGSLTLVAAAIDDAGAWALLAVVIALAAAGSATGALVTILGAALFAGLMLTVGRRLLGPLARHVELTGTMTHGSMLAVLLVVLGCAWFTDLIGIHSVLGGFIAGLAMPASPVLRRELATRLMDMNAVLLLPVFFVFSGLNTQLSGLTELSLVPVLLLIMVVAFVGKYLGCAVAVRMHGFSWRHASAVGALMNARGLMVLIFINVGLAHGLITQELFAILVVVAVVTTASALPLYRASFPDWLEDAERDAGTRPPEPRSVVAASTAVTHTEATH
ncbi:MAG: cation:proton antiporter [Actinobacteria bacterium]|nr:cation:proton antiporter [Actinomycetota bacterium]